MKYIKKYEFFDKFKKRFEKPGDKIIDEILSNDIDVLDIKNNIEGLGGVDSYFYKNYRVIRGVRGGHETGDSSNYYDFRIENDDMYYEPKASNKKKKQLFNKLEELYKEFNTDIKKYNL